MILELGFDSGQCLPCVRALKLEPSFQTTGGENVGLQPRRELHAPCVFAHQGLAHLLEGEINGCGDLRDVAEQLATGAHAPETAWLSIDAPSLSPRDHQANWPSAPLARQSRIAATAPLNRH